MSPQVKWGMTGLRGTMAVGCCCVAAALLAACGNSSTAPTAPSTSTQATSALATGAPPFATPNTAMTPNAAPPAACSGDDLTVTLGPQYGAMGHLIQRIDFTNHGTGACTIAGYPGVALGGGTPPMPIGLSASRTQRDPSTGSPDPRAVQLAPHTAAHAIVQVTRAENIDPTTCDPIEATLLIVYPPGGSTAAQLPFHAVACANPVRLLEVTFVSAGA